MKIFGFYLMNKKGLSVLNSLIESKKHCQIAYVVGSTDKNVAKDYYTEIQKICNTESILFFNKHELPEIKTDYKVAIGWRWIINEPDNLIILHDSILPKYRGFAPLVNSLINKEEFIGVTALFGSEDYDKGDIIKQNKIKVSYPIKINDAINMVSNLYQELILSVLDICENENFTGQKQNEQDASYSLWRDENDYFINWSWSATKIKRFVDALGYPYDYAKTHAGKEIIRIKDVKLVTDILIEDREGQNGKIVFVKNKNPVIICRKGLIEITNKDYDIVPLFVKDEEGELHIISSYNKDIKEVQKGFKLVYLGKPLETVV